MCITNDFASDSEFRDDSDADDGLPIPAIISEDTPQPGSSSNQPMKEDLDTDGSVDDHDYTDPYTQIRIIIIYFQVQVQTWI
jgi:hypothetical protein